MTVVYPRPGAASTAGPCDNVPEMARERHAFRGLVPERCAGERLDRVAAELLADFSRSRVTAWIRDGKLTVDGRHERPAYRVLGGEPLVLDVEVEAHGPHEPEPVPFDLIHEDEHVLVVDKPAGVVVHPGAGNPAGTLVNGLLAHRPALAALPRAGLVHRLDKDTSGLLVVAANEAAHRVLVDAMAKREIERVYLAVVEGVLTAGRDVELAIGRDPARRTRQRVREDGRPALTRVRVQDRYRAHTAVQATLGTGRTHQVRVHLSAIGHPLVGDRRYGARGRLPTHPSPGLVEAVRGFRRQALHARTLGFRHPASGTAFTFSSPVPEDIARLLVVLEDDAARDA